MCSQEKLNRIDFEELSLEQRQTICHSLLHCINWKRELVKHIHGHMHVYMYTAIHTRERETERQRERERGGREGGREEERDTQAGHTHMDIDRYTKDAITTIMCQCTGTWCNSCVCFVGIGICAVIRG